MKKKPVVKGGSPDMNEDGEGNEGQAPEQEGSAADQEEDEEEDEAAKSNLTEDDLVKSLAALEALASTGNPVSRKQALLRKAQASDLTKGETDELYALMGGGTDGGAVEPGLADTITKGMQENDNLQKALDVSEYLSAHQEELVKSLERVAEALDAKERRQHEFNLVLAKAVCDSGAFVKAMSQRLGVIETQPARGPRSVGVPGAQPQVLNKGFMGAASGGEQLSKGETLQTMMDMLEKSTVDGRNGLSPHGEDIAMAVAGYEQIGALSKAMARDIQEFRKSRHAA